MAPTATKKRPGKALSSKRTPKTAIKMIPCESSNVKAFGYDPITRTLRVEFHNGGVYDYAKVPTAKFSALKKATSVGAYLAKNVFGPFKATKVN